MMRRVSLVPTLLLCVATVAFPCGGSEVYDISGPLLPAREFAERALGPMTFFEFMPRDEIRFLPGVMHAVPASVRELVGRASARPFQWDSLPTPLVAEPTTMALDAAWVRGDVAGAVRAAESIVSRVMALPAADDSARNAALRLAVETLELAPSVSHGAAASRRATFEQLARPFRNVPFDSMGAVLARDPSSVRSASLAYGALRSRVQRRIPDASREEIAKQMTRVAWDSLHAAHRAWLAAYPTHPYAALVRFARLRLFFLASDADSAWHSAVELYGSYPSRSAAEMRYLLLTGVMPPASLLTDARVPAEIRVALVGNLRPSPAAWDSLMHMAAAQRSARWSENLEERLLAALATDTLARSALPEAFPAWRARATPLWRYLWAVSMVRAGKLAEAAQFAATPITKAQDSLLVVDAAQLSARIRMLRGEWAAAVRAPGLDEWTRRYILRVLAPDSVPNLLLTPASAAIARDARLVLATRAAQAGQWNAAAAQVQRVDAARAARYARVATLVRDTVSNAGLLRFAQALAVMHGQLFYEETRYFYRGMMYRDYDLGPDRDAVAWDLPWSRAEERQRLYAYLRSGSERYLALRAYASYFSRAGVTTAQRRAAVRDADRAYRALLATDPSHSDSGYWADSLPGSAEARAIRRAGRS